MKTTIINNTLCILFFFSTIQLSFAQSYKYEYNFDKENDMHICEMQETFSDFFAPGIKISVLNRNNSTTAVILSLYSDINSFDIIDGKSSHSSVVSNVFYRINDKEGDTFSLISSDMGIILDNGEYISGSFELIAQNSLIVINLIVGFTNANSNKIDLTSMDLLRRNQYVSQQLRTYDIKEIRIRDENEKFSNLRNFHSAATFDAMFNTLGEKMGNPDLYRYSQSKSFTHCPDNNHPHAIDLGLPSGTKWACCNVGASRPEEYGGYYAWGETEVQANNEYYWGSYKHCDGSRVKCHHIGDDISGTQYDVAHVKMGGSWRMPTVVQVQELLDHCKWTWTQRNGRKGIEGTGRNGGKVFLPFAGFRSIDSLVTEGSHGWFWSSSLNAGVEPEACFFVFESDYNGWKTTSRENGLSVRAVCP